jgi:hypothetical protein
VINQLKRRTIARPVKNIPWVMEIGVIGQNPATAARIANAVAAAYCDFRLARIRREKISDFQFMIDEYQREAANITVQRAKLRKLKEQLNLRNQAGTAAIAESNYAAIYRSLTRAEAIHERRNAVIASLKSNDNSSVALAAEFGVKIVSPSAPPPAPVGPARAPDMVLLFCGLVISGFGLVNGTRL